jgi:hypothetical protein
LRFYGLKHCHERQRFSTNTLSPDSYKGSFNLRPLLDHEQNMTRKLRASPYRAGSEMRIAHPAISNRSESGRQNLCHFLLRTNPPIRQTLGGDTGKHL